MDMMTSTRIPSDHGDAPMKSRPPTCHAHRRVGIRERWQHHADMASDIHVAYDVGSYMWAALVRNFKRIPHGK
jgi:hypothetical protein